MIVISDSNVIFSALITPEGTPAQIFKSSKIQFIAPVYLIEEVKEHFQKIVVFSKRSKTEVRKDLNLILSKIKLISLDDIPAKYLIESNKITIDIDREDSFFVAVNRYTHHKLWTGDRELIKGLKAKGYDICITTAELKKYIYKK